MERIKLETLVLNANYKGCENKKLREFKDRLLFGFTV